MNSILGKWIKKRNKSDFVVLILLGVMVSCGTVVILTLMDDTIKSEEDVEHYLGIPTLAVVAAAVDGRFL